MATLKLAVYDEKGVLAIDLVHILAALESYGRELRWSILWVRGTGPGVVVLEERILSAETGLVTNWSELRDFAKRFIQIEDTLIIGTDPASPLPIRDGEIGTTYPIVIEAVDSSYWLISGIKEPILNDLARELGASL